IDFALAEVVEGVADMIAPKAHDKGLELLISIDDGIPPFLHGDPTRLRQVLFNLAGNAVKFTEKGEIVVKCELLNAEWGAVSNQYSVISKQDKAQTEAIACGHEVKGEGQGKSNQQPDKNPTFQTPKSEIHNVTPLDKSILLPEISRDKLSYGVIRFSVTDTGIGIPKEKQHLVFESFSQADGSTTRKYGGTGLGLAISKQLAVLMGGEIGVESEAGKGSTFWFTARLAKAEKPVEVRKGKPGDISELEGRRMLVIDDNATNRLILKKALENHGCLVETAKSGRAALQMLQEKCDKCATFDFILLDMMMPEMDGKETARRIRESGCADSPIIVMASSAGTKPAKEEMQQLGIRHYLTKPIKIARLLKILLQSIDGDNTGATSSKVTVVSADDLNTKQTPRLHILLAEDNIVNQKLATRLLGKNGFSVDVVANGIEAVEAFERINYDLVLMDVHMPEVDGLEATMMIREKENSTGGHIPIIALTANAMKGDRERCLAAGMDGYVSKPIQKEELFDAIAGLAAQSAKDEPGRFDVKDVDEETEHLKPAQTTSQKERSQ
ncbi:MAG: response regulator, partial [bacterium]